MMMCLFCGVEVQKPGPCEKCRQERTKKMVEEAARARAEAAQAAQAQQTGTRAATPAPVETVAGPEPETPIPAPMKPQHLIWIGLGVAIAVMLGAVETRGIEFDYRSGYIFGKLLVPALIAYAIAGRKKVFVTFRRVYRRLSSLDWRDFTPSDWRRLPDHLITIGPK